jgi:hypothetical protein
LIGGNNFDLSKISSQVIAYKKILLNPIIWLPLRIYDNGPFGTTTANFATQVTLETVKPTIGIDPIIESVVLTIPYFSALKADVQQVIILIH